MGDYYLRLLMQLVHANADTASLVKQGLTYSQISKLIVSAISEGYIYETEHAGLLLTDKGLSFVGLKKLTGKTRNIANWISIDKSSKIDKLSTDDVFLPNLENSFFGN